MEPIHQDHKVFLLAEVVDMASRNLRRAILICCPQNNQGQKAELEAEKGMVGVVPGGDQS